MNISQEAYCRLCAERKSDSKLQNLQLDDQKLQEIAAKLSRLNGFVDFSVASLPKTVCYVCENTLNDAIKFVAQVETAQATLAGLISKLNIKMEITEYDSNFSYELKDEIEVKEEDVDQRLTVKTGRTRKNGPNIDSIPLSQLNLTWKDYSWVCAFCETQFSHIDELRAHSLQYHKCCNAFKCSDCNTRKLRFDKFLQHIKQHRGYLKLSCYVCNASLSNSKQWKKHKLLHMNSNHICPGCNVTFQSSDELIKHKDTFYEGTRGKTCMSLLKKRSTENLTCFDCKEVFKTKTSLKIHLLTHAEITRDHVCEICGKRILTKQNLRDHMLLHDNARPYKCEICKQFFRSKVQLRHHVGVHDTHKPFACEQCGRCFRLKSQLKSHLIIHTDAWPYACSVCDKRFRFKTILNQHLREHTGIKPYSCEPCQREFANWPNYNKHMKRRHNTDMAKKKHTPNGLYPLNPQTGEVIMYEQTEDIEQWKKRILKKESNLKDKAA